MRGFNLLRQGWFLLKDKGKAIGLQMDSRTEEAFRRALLGNSKAEDYRAKTIEQRGVTGVMSDLLGTLDRAGGLMEEHEKAVLRGSAPMIRVGLLQSIGEALTYIGGGIAAAAGIALTFAEAAGTVAIVATGFTAVGFALMFVGAVGWLLGEYMDEYYAA